MLSIELQFPAGRYHATPWGRNVNEGEVEWPPSPYRLIRSLIDVWKRRKPDWPEEKVIPLLEAISHPPVFYLPPASAAHTRSFLSSNERDWAKKQLIFDAFVALDRSHKLQMGFECDLPPDAINDLNQLLEELNYFGRSESWIRAKAVKRLSQNHWNCLPAADETDISNTETVPVACAISPYLYAESAHKPEGTNWIDALCMSTKRLLSEGWSNPPALLWVDYKRKESALQPLPPRRSPLLKERFRCAKYALHSKVLPRVQETTAFAERVRTKLMGIHRNIENGDPNLVSQKFSGKNPNGAPLRGHKHAFFLPVDEDGDGRLEHLIIFAKDPYTNSELIALDRLRSIWQPNRQPDVTLVLAGLLEDVPTQSSDRWVSVTPFVTSRHYRKGRGTYGEWLTDEIKRECVFHKIPIPKTVHWTPHTLNKRSPIRWIDFIRSRKNKPYLRGYGCLLEFDEPVSGPFVLGSGCHFGLGLFEPYENESRTCSYQ